MPEKARVPRDDNFLEMEDVERFVPKADHARGGVSHQDIREQHSFRGRCLFYVVTVGSVLVVLFGMDILQIQIHVGKSGIQNVEEKGACYVCGEGRGVTKGDETVPMLKGRTCLEIELSGVIGLIEPSQCSQVQKIMNLMNPCGCDEVGALPSQIQPATPLPSSSNLEPVCHVCGEGNSVGKEESQDQIAGKSCEEVENLGKLGMISTDQCSRITEIFRERNLCGCAPAASQVVEIDPHPNTENNQEVLVANTSQQEIVIADPEPTNTAAVVQSNPLVSTDPQPNPAPNSGTPVAPSRKAGFMEPVNPKPEDDKGGVAPDDGGASAYPEPSLIVRPDPPLTAERENALVSEWGKWNFVDNKADTRPRDDYCGAFPNCDIPREKMPPNAWQIDSEYLKGFLDEGLNLVDRAMEAILSEYGKGKKHMPDADFETRSRLFQLRYLNLPNDRFTGKEFPKSAGEITQRSFEGLVRRVLHSLVARDSFGVVVGGHSAAAGHGNHFVQNYAMQFHKVMEPVFATLGVPLTSRNLAHGGLGTLESSLGSRDVYGRDIDILIWDSGMTEARDGKAVDMFLRQGLLGGDKVPFLYGGLGNLLTVLHENADADVGITGQGILDEIPETKDEIHAKSLPFAVQYMRCDKERNDLCNQNKFRGLCWVEWDQFTPTTKQNDVPGSRVGWHPGFRWHQLVGRCLAFTVLRAMKAALSRWKNADNFALPDEAWHVTDYYNNIRDKVRNLDPSLGECFKGYQDAKLPTRVCKTRMNGRTEFTPRANAYESSLQSIIHPAPRGYYDGSGIPHLPGKLVYTGPGPHNPLLEVPDGEVDVLAIVSAGRDYNNVPSRKRQLAHSTTLQVDPIRREESRSLAGDEMTTGAGLAHFLAYNGFCDGTYNMECNRPDNFECLMVGHADARGGYMLGGYSGWLTMTLRDVKEGLILLKLETWHDEQNNYRTTGWTSINNEISRNLHVDALEYQQIDGDDRRSLKRQPPPYCDDFKFEYAIDGNVKSLNSSEFADGLNDVLQRVVEVQTILDDPNFTTEPKDVVVSIRQLGCADTTRKAMKLTHVYWA